MKNIFSLAIRKNILKAYLENCSWIPIFGKFKSRWPQTQAINISWF